MVSGQATIINEYGIHCRPSAQILKEVTGYEGTMKVSCNGLDSGLKSIIELLALGIKKGDTVSLEVEGPEEAQMLDKLIQLFQTNFDFKR